VQLPEGVDQQASTMSEKLVAFRLPLSPIPGVVYPQYAEGTRHADQYAQPNKNSRRQLS
jgi:hypothetical protein